METRKHIRLKEYDYSQNGYYFITICTAEKSKILCDIPVGANCVRPKQSDIPVGANCVRPKQRNIPVGANCVRPQMTFSEIGKLVDENIGILNDTYDTVRVDKYVIMPNHINLFVAIQNGRTQFAPTVSRIIKQFKGKITKQVGFCIWQKSFYDHIIRDETDYLRIWEYIENNPDKWAEDKYFI